MVAPLLVSDLVERVMVQGMRSARRLPQYLGELQVRHDTLISLVVGLVLGLGIIMVLSWYPGEPFDYSQVDGVPRDKQTAIGGGEETPPQPGVATNTGPTVQEILADEGKIMNSRGVQRVKRWLGLSDDQILEAIRQAQKDANSTGALTENFRDHGSLSAKADFIFYVVAFSALIYFINRDYGGLATKWFRLWFPNEASLLLGSEGGDEL